MHIVYVVFTCILIDLFKYYCIPLSVLCFLEFLVYWDFATCAYRQIGS